MKYIEHIPENFNKKKMVIYTVIIGKYDDLLTPMVIDKDCDYICLTDDESMTSKFWEVILVKDTMNLGNIRFNRFLKINPHKIFFNYDISLYIDGNVQINKSMRALINQYSTGRKMLLFANKGLNCIYESAEALKIAKKDDSNLIDKQIERIRQSGYPENYGMVSAGILYREHNDNAVIKNMEDWWKMLQEGSRRDQLSFNYVCWKNQFKFDLCPLIPEDNEYFTLLDHEKKSLHLKNCKGDILELNNGEIVIIYGAGWRGLKLLKYFERMFGNFSVLYCDKKFASIGDVKGISVISPSQYYKEYFNQKVVISSLYYSDEIKEDLLKNHIKEEYIYQEVFTYIKD